VTVGFGSDCSEEPGHVRSDAGHAGFSDVLALSSGPPGLVAQLRRRGDRLGQSRRSATSLGDGVADVPFQNARIAFCESCPGLFAEVVRAARVS